MKAWVQADAAQSSAPKQSTRRGVREKFSRWLTEIGRSVNSVIKNFFRPSRPTSQFTAEQRAEAGAEEAGALPTPTENGIAEPDIITFTVQVTADVKVNTNTPIESAAPIVLDQKEIQRRRDLVRTMFNDFWSGADQKPVAFVERLNQAEDYLNERLTANGEAWRLDATTRTLLGLPLRSSST